MHDPQNTYIVTTKYYVLLFLLSVSVVYLPAARCPEKFPRGSPFGLKLLQRWKVDWGTGIRGLMRGMAALPEGNQELLVVRDKVGTTQVSLGSANPWNVIFSLQCFDTVGWATGRASGL